MTRQTYWAAYVGTAHGSEITLHATERDALVAIAEVLDLAPTPDEDADELREAIADHCGGSPDDWAVQEVETP